MTGFLDVTWTCHSCGEERPDAMISVYQIDISHKHDLPEGAVIKNNRYCNDRPECFEKAQDNDYDPAAPK